MLALDDAKAFLMILKHDLHRAQDRGGLGLKLAQAGSDLPEGRDTSPTKAKEGRESGWVHGRRSRRSSLAALRARSYLRP